MALWLRLNGSRRVPLPKSRDLCHKPHVVLPIPVERALIAPLDDKWQNLGRHDSTFGECNHVMQNPFVGKKSNCTNDSLA
ncbi:hypothetical protein VTO42DRAFT_7691 [Malbranchea cinnamomea]